MAETMDRPRKSVRLTFEELTALKEYRETFHTAYECALSIGIDQNVLARVLLAATGAPETVKRIKKAIKKSK